MMNTMIKKPIVKKHVRGSLPMNKLDIRQVKRVHLVQRVVACIEEQILSGRISSDQLLPPEGQLCLDLGVSRTVVREAMRILETRGLVEVCQGKLSRVKAIDPTHAINSLTRFLQRADHPLLHLVEVRQQLETGIARLAARRATPEQLEAMEAANEDLVHSNTLDQQIDADLHFHTLLADASGNPVFGVLLAPLGYLMRLSRRETLSQTGMERAIVGHREILAAVQRHDPDAAQRAMLDHLTWAELDLGGKRARAKRQA